MQASKVHPTYEVDEGASLLFAGETIDVELFQNLTQPIRRDEVIEMGELEAQDQLPTFTLSTAKVADEPTGPVWTVTKTMMGNDMMTIIDSGAVKAAVTRRTVEASNSVWTEGSDVKFIKADGTTYTPAGVCEAFTFNMGSVKFKVRAYVVDQAPFQLLLGTQFLWATGAGIFPKWNRVIITVPTLMEYKVSTVGPTKTNTPPPLVPGNEPEDIEVDVGPVASLSIPDGIIASTSLCTFQQATAIVLGEKDLVAECDGPIALADAEAVRPTDIPTLSVEFVKKVFEFGPTVPPQVVDQVCLDIIEFADAYSWHEFDLGCITDVPHVINVTDNDPVVFPSRPALYLPKNERVIKAKCTPLIDMGVFRRARQDCKNRAQLVVARRQPADGEDPEDLRNYRVAHDFRGLNAKTILDPWPMTTLEEMTMWVAQWSVFYKVDADRGFNQVVMLADSIPHTGFEMFHQLWVSVRMNFGVLNGPATFARNADVMLGDMKFDRKIVKNYFDDIVGGASRGDWDHLRQSKRELLQRCRNHGWKLKPKKESFGYEELEIVGHLFRDGFISVPTHRIDAMQRMKYPENATALKSLLGLANTFRDRLPGFSMRVPNLIALTRMKGRLTLSPEAIAELDHLKDCLRSPAVLMCFQPGRETYVYTDASIGHHDTAGGLGAVITQVMDGHEYVCAYASATLSPAQKNYHIARLEALAFVWICGKFNNWMQAQAITWRNDSRANKFIQDTRFSHNPALCRYALELQQFKYKMEWVPGVKLISDPLSRLIVIPAAAKEDFTLPEIVFGRDLGAVVFASKHAPSPGKAIQCPSILARSAGVTNRWVERTASPYETTDGEPFHMFVMCEFISAEKISIPETGQADLSPQRTHNPVIGGKGDDKVLGPEGVSPVQLSVYDKELLELLASCRGYLIGEESPTGRRRRMLKRLTRDMVWEEGFLWKETKVGRLRVLPTAEEFEAVMREVHDGMGHRQLRAVIGYFATRFWIPASAKLIKSYIRSCKTCQKFCKNNTLHSPGYSPRAVDVFTHWSIDFAGPFPEDEHTGCKYVILAVDFLSRWVEGRAVKAADAAVAATFIYEDIVCRYGTPESLQSDNGTHFVNEVITNLSNILKINHHRSTPYYPQSNGRIERVVGTIKTSLKKMVEDLREDGEKRIAWAGSLPAVLWVYRCTPHSITKVSPSFLVFGKDIKFPMDGPANTATAPDTTEEHRELIAQRIRFISDIIPGIRDERRTPEKSPGNPPGEFHVGDWVWLRETKYDGAELCPVFAPRWTGPFQVWEVWDKGAYRLRSDPKYSGKKTTSILRNPVNANRLRQYVEREWMLETRAEIR